MPTRPRVEIEEQRARHPSLLGEVDEVAVLIPSLASAAARPRNAVCLPESTDAMSRPVARRPVPSSVVCVSDPARAQYSVDENV